MNKKRLASEKDFLQFDASNIYEVEVAERHLQKTFINLEELCFYNQAKVLHAMHHHSLRATDFYWPTGYGYGDTGRDKVEAIYATLFETEDALVRPSIASGTHAIFLVLNSLLQSGDRLVFATDRPYDTLQKAVGLVGSEPGNLIDKGVVVETVALHDGKIDYPALEKALAMPAKVVMFQRSTGYSLRRAFTVDELEEVFSFCKRLQPDSILFVDNCYGEFTMRTEPTQHGADIMAGSLIKNPGGGLSLSGGYIAGKSTLIEKCANQLTAPGLGKEVGLSFGTTRTTLQGLFLAPQVTKEAMKGAYLFQKVFSSRGYLCIPQIGEPRSDIVLSIIFQSADILQAFAKAIQQAAPVDGKAVPVAWDMPGYADPVIMASGSFIDGSSMELSADAPMREPYAAYYQGGLTYAHCKIALLYALEEIDRHEKKRSV